MLLRAGVPRSHGADATHPAIHLSPVTLLIRPPVSAAVLADAEEWRAIDGEPAEVRERPAREILRSGR
ncbi:hypothetical protein [Streptomyces sp. NPDC057557]|uniref:hypothetical protein n=1 Tax=Streptomyces sp. NPDC057557 TaxID=3346167 RepID=UPI00368CA2F2